LGPSCSPGSFEKLFRNAGLSRLVSLKEEGREEEKEEEGTNIDPPNSSFYSFSIATITSEEENAFVRGHLLPGSGPNNIYWLGGRANVDSANPSNFLWATGPEAGEIFFDADTSTCVGSFCGWNSGFSGNGANQRIVTIVGPTNGWGTRSYTIPASKFSFIVEYGDLCLDTGLPGKFSFLPLHLP
jgi:hypothetical protein